jgi:hypothetical protein
MNSRPMANRVFEKDLQYTTRARAQKSPRRDLMSKRLPGSQIRCVITRAPRELMFCVRTGSVIDGSSKLYNCTGSTADIRASDRDSRTGGLSFDGVRSGGITLPAFRALRILLDGTPFEASFGRRIHAIKYH